MLTATVSGSFHRHLREITESVEQLTDHGVRVLSPADPRIVDELGPFLFVASDRHRSVKLVQDRHLTAIGSSSFLWLVSPDGYVGQSAALEIGFAIASGVPIFANTLPPDLTLREYVNLTRDVDEAIQLASNAKGKVTMASLLLDPLTAAEEVHKEVDELAHLLTTYKQPKRGREMTVRVESGCRNISAILALPLGALK
ncbi:MAG TPA: hypothetical protein VOA87_09195 [Thermoanaerobaculia bacterium]|nr:hypothetical protein [Thermoanaerobaculia bacterium]